MLGFKLFPKEGSPEDSPALALSIGAKGILYGAVTLETTKSV